MTPVRLGELFAENRAGDPARDRADDAAPLGERLGPDRFDHRAIAARGPGRRRLAGAADAAHRHAGACRGSACRRLGAWHHGDRRRRRRGRRPRRVIGPGHGAALEQQGLGEGRARDLAVALQGRDDVAVGPDPVARADHVAPLVDAGLRLVEIDQMIDALDVERDRCARAAVDAEIERHAGRERVDLLEIEAIDERCRRRRRRAGSPPAVRPMQRPRCRRRRPATPRTKADEGRPRLLLAWHQG